jgi:hypothetical protein
MAAGRHPGFVRLYPPLQSRRFRNSARVNVGTKVVVLPIGRRAGNEDGRRGLIRQRRQRAILHGKWRRTGAIFVS